jgi:phosphate starvation-inducible membrane PsiE
MNSQSNVLHACISISTKNDIVVLKVLIFFFYLPVIDMSVMYFMKNKHLNHNIILKVQDCSSFEIHPT